MTINLTPEDIRALGVLCELANKCPDQLEQIAKQRGVTPVMMVGLVMTLESLTEEQDIDLEGAE